MHTINYLISLAGKDRSWGFFLFRILSHSTVTIYFCENIDVPFPDILLIFELLEEKCHKNTHLCFDSFFYYFQLSYNLLNFRNQISAVTSLARRERVLFGYFKVLFLWDLHFIALFYMCEWNIRTSKSYPDLVKLQLQFALDFSLLYQ